jgi:hypothetical protein
MFKVHSPGSFKKTESFLEFMRAGKEFKDLDRYGRMGVDALSNASPRDTGRMASSWGYQIGHTDGVYSISWFNTDREGGINVAVILQYGHGTGTGGYVVGIDYINPAIRPIMERALEDMWRQVRNA